MSTCTAKEIAEKKRIALEKLKSKKAQLETLKTNNSSTNIATGSTITQNKAVTVQKFYNKTENNKEQFLNSIRNPNVAKNVNNHKNNNQQVANIKKSTDLAAIFRKIINCDCYIISENRFAVKTSAYSDLVINIFKEIPSKAYDNNTRIWSFSLSDYKLVQERIGALKPDVTIGTIPKNILNLFSEPQEELNYSCLVSIELKIVNALLPFQKDGVCFGILKHGRIMIADEMGLGKTYQALAIADFYKDDWPILICTTASTRNSWVKHVRELFPSISCHYIVCLTSGQQFIDNAKVVIISYSLLESHIDLLLEKNFGIVILDESHSLKSRDAKRTITAERLTKKARRIILLSGTPALSRPVELFCQLQMIDRSFFNYHAYTSRYCEGKQTNFGWDATGQSNLPELNAILNRKFMIRRTKSEVLPELAEKIRETIILDPTFIWINDNLKTDISKLEHSFTQSSGAKAKELLLTFYSKTAEIKAKSVCEYLKSVVKENMKFLVFAHHKVMINAISDMFKKLKLDFIRIDGSTKNELRNEYIDKFQNKESCRAAVLSLLACNSGITLTSAQLVIFAELDWNPSTLVQAESRAHRIGQKDNVICRYLIAENTADDIMWKMLKNKQNVLQTAGLFSDDLQNSEFSKAITPSKNKIEDFFQTKRKSPTESVTLASNSVKRIKINDEENCDENEFKNFLSDDDEDFANLIF